MMFQSFGEENASQYGSCDVDAVKDKALVLLAKCIATVHGTWFRINLVVIESIKTNFTGKN
jgi:hypothetical protein